MVVSLLVVKRQATILVVTENGYGKRSQLNDYRITNRGGKGIYTVKVTERTGKMIALMEVNDNEELVVITSKGMVIRTAIKDIRIAGRNTQGVRIIRLNDGDHIADISRVVPDDEEVNGNGNGNGADPSLETEEMNGDTLI